MNGRRSARSVLALLALAACASEPLPGGVTPSERMAPCPSSPNCVWSGADASDTQHAIAPLAFEGDPEAAWHAARAAVMDLPRTRVVVHEPGYLAAECRSALFRFVDDLELRLDPEKRQIEVRSASRTGYGDMGVNRRRVESLRASLAERGFGAR